MPSPLTSGAALIHAATLTGNLEGGWEYYEALKDNGAVAGGGNGDVLKQVAGGEKLYGVIVDYMPIREKAKGAPIEFVFPKEGVSAVSEPVAILKSTKNPEAARAFVDFLLSKEGQELALKQGYIAGAPGGRAAGRLSRPRADQGHGVRRRQERWPTRPRTRRPSPTSSDSETFTEQDRSWSGEVSASSLSSF